LATVTPASWRSALYTRMKATAGVEFTDAQLDEAGRAAFNAAFPALHVRVVERDIVPVLNTDTLYSKATVADASRVYRVRDTRWDYDIRGWEIDDATTICRIPGEHDAVDVYSIAAVEYPTVSDTIPNGWLDALLTYGELALVEMLMNDYSQFRGYRANTREGMVDEGGLLNMHTNLYNKWSRERDERALGLPVGVA
jgi:hypothetical protein